MHNFVILFEEKEGTSPVVRLLDNFPGISIVHQVEDGWEPFNSHNAGSITDADFAMCLDIMFGSSPMDLDALNALYEPKATRPLAPVEDGTSIGFKMRFRSNERRGRRLGDLIRPTHSRAAAHARFRSMMFERLVTHDVVVFMAVRQDLFRWALSKYHGDGTGKSGHLQFKLASGELAREDIANITVDCDRLEEIIRDCEDRHRAKRALVDDLTAAGVKTSVLRYEDFVRDKYEYFTQLVHSLGSQVSNEVITAALNAGSYFEKVHSDDISDFVTNHEEVTDRFSDRFSNW